jgi:hypothetical protein
MSDDEYGDGDGELVNEWDAFKRTEIIKKSRQEYAQMSGPEKFNARMEKYLSTIKIDLPFPFFQELYIF